MDRYKYIIIDDDDFDRLSANYYLKNYSFIEHKASFSTAADALHYLENNKIDILFLDIEMPKINGLELAKKIKENATCVVFITSHPEFALEGYNLDAFDFITKPLSKERFDLCMYRIKEYLALKFKADLFEHCFKNDTILVKSGHDYISIQPYQIVCLEALKDYTKIVLLNNKSTTIHGNLGSVLKEDNFKHFIRIHKSYAIQKSYINIIKTNEIILTNGKTLPIGQNYRKMLLGMLL